MKTLLTIAVAAAFLALSGAAGTAIAKKGFGSETETTQGNSGKPANPNQSDNSQGTKTETTTGPKGALKNDKETPNQDTSSSGPGNSGGGGGGGGSN
jgi:hypothetical protein